MTSTKYIKTIVITLMLVLSMGLVSAADISGEWANYQNHPSNDGFESVGVSYFDNASLYCSSSQGMDYQALTGDFDADGNTEYVIFASSSIKVFDNTCTTKYELNIGTDLTGQPSLYDNNSVAFVGADNVGYIFDLSDNTSITNEFNFTVEASCADFSGTVCDNDFCYVLCDNDTATFLYKFNTTYSFTNTSTVDSILEMRQSPALGYLTSAIYKSLAIACDADSDDSWGYCVFETVGLSLDTGYSGDGIYDGLTDDAGNALNNPLIYDIDGGNNELIYTYVVCNDGAGDDYYGNIRIQDDDGTVLDTHTETIHTNVGGTCRSGGARTISPPVISLFDTDDVICSMMGSNGTGSLILFKGFVCIDGSATVKLRNDDALPFQSFISPSDLTYQPDLISAQLSLTTSSGDRDLMLESGIIDDSNSTIVDFSSQITQDRENRISLTDFNDDNVLDIIMTQGGQTLIFSSSYDNAVPELTGTRNYGQNFASPLCIGTTITFNAKECGTEPCHYTNDIPTDQERLITNCGINATFYNGSYSLSTPQVSCTYANTGSYSATIYLQDSVNPSNYSQFQTVFINVINGTAGLTCNLPISSDTVVGADITTVVSGDQITSEDELKEAIDIVTGQSSFVKALLVLIFTMALVIGMIKYSVNNVLVYIVAVFCLWLCFAFVGLIDWVYIFIYSMSLIGLGFFGFVSRKGGE